MRDNKNLKICEIFDSISGEGLRAGKVCTFTRFSGCNLDCAFCDTKYHKEVSYILDIKDIEHEYKIRNKIVGRKYVIFTEGFVDKFHKYYVYNDEREIYKNRYSLGLAKKICENFADFIMNEKVKYYVPRRNYYCTIWKS